MMSEASYEEIAKRENLNNNKAHVLAPQIMKIPRGDMTFNVSHGNMGLKKSLASKTTILREFLIAGNIHVCFISESGELNERHNNLIQGYSILNHHTPTNRGICWVVIDTFKKFTKIKYINDRVSILTIETPQEKWTIVGVYGPHTKKPEFWNSIKPKLKPLSKEDNVAIIGDFNLHLMDEIPKYAKFLTKNFELQENNEFTFVSNAATNIDFTLISNTTMSLLKLHRVLGMETSLSATHSFTIDQFINNSLPTPIFNARIESDLLYKPNSIPICDEIWKWRPKLKISKTASLKEMNQSFTEHIQGCVDDSFGARPRYIANPYKNRLSKEQQKFVHRVDFLIKTHKTMRAYLKYKTEATFSKLQRQYSYVMEKLGIPLPVLEKEKLLEIKTMSKVIKIEKREKTKCEKYQNTKNIRDKVDNIKSLHKKNPKAFFQMAKPSHIQKKNFLTTVEHNGHFITKPTELTQAVSDHYEEQFKETTQEKAPFLTVDMQFPEFKLPSISIKELKSLINKLPKRRSCGPDGIPYEILKMLREKDELKHLYNLINKCIEEKQIPESWKLSRICLIHKDGDCNSLKNYRPIALLNTIYKILLKKIILLTKINLVSDQISQFMIPLTK
jgi:hypothetical protein